MMLADMGAEVVKIEEPGKGDDTRKWPPFVAGEGGIMDITGFPDGPPVKVGNSIGDLVAGMSAAHGIVLALLARVRTRRGQKVEIGMLDVMASLLTYQAGTYFNTGGKPSRRGN